MQYDVNTGCWEMESEGGYQQPAAQSYELPKGIQLATVRQNVDQMGLIAWKRVPFMKWCI